MFGLSYSSNINYDSYWGGTSQAAPHVAGLISLLLSLNSNLTVDEVITILEDTSEDEVGDWFDTSGWDQYYGHGRINAFQALTHETLSVNTFEIKDKELLVYPNPTTSGSNLTILNLIKGNNVINIYNIIGQNVYNKRNSTSSNSTTITIPELNPGTYLLKINNRSENISTIKKLIIK